MTRFDQRLERGFDGQIDEQGALAVGEFELVSLEVLSDAIARDRKELASIGSTLHLLDLKEASDALALLINVEYMEEELRSRNKTANA